MSFEQDIELIDSYNDWVLERKRMATDLTPEAFLEDKMRKDAAERVVKALDYIETFGPYMPTDAAYRDYDDLKYRHSRFRTVEEILRGDL